MKLLFIAALCLTPPISQGELKETASWIVQGSVTQVECRPLQPKISECGKQIFYRATLKVNKVLKKPEKDWAPDLMTVYFTRMHYKRGCVGDQDHFHTPGEVGTYYLRNVNGGWRPLNWSAVQLEKEGDPSKVPGCSKEK